MKSRKPDQVKGPSKVKPGNRHRNKLRNALRTFETLEDRRLLAVAPWSDGKYYPPIGISTAYLPPSMTYQQYAAISAQQYGGKSSGGGNGEGTQGFASVSEKEPNDVYTKAQVLNLGTLPSNNDGISVLGNLTNSASSYGDEDYYAVDLRAGDIVDAVVVGSVNRLFDIAFLDSNRRELIGNQRPVGGGYPIPASPLSTGGNASLAFVVPATGRYFMRVSEGGILAPLPVNSYTLTLRASRPALEAQPVGTVQKIFLDFDGATIRREAFGAFGTARLSPLSSFLAGWGLQPSDESRIIDKIIKVFNSKLNGPTAISGVGGNGSYFGTGTAGQFGFQILNSRDHADPFGDPNVSRVIIGGTQLELLIPTIGIAESIDVGNFNTSESSVVLLDLINPLWGPIPRAGNVPLEDVLTAAVGAVAAHEVGHFFGAWHTLNNNASDQIMDSGGNLTGLIGVGLDGIFGTPDDRDVQFGTDTYDPFASAIDFGQQNSSAALAWGLASGKTGGGTVKGTVFNDRNLSRAFDAGDAAFPGVMIYTDLNGDSTFNSGEYFALSAADGSYSIALPAGSYVLRETVPSGWRLTTPDKVNVSVVANQTRSNVNFGNELLNPSITGTKFNDINGNGLQDAGEAGIQGVYIYIDLDGDNRIDIGEPSTQTTANGTYKLNFPGPGTYTIREVVDPGYVQTFPGPAVDNEHTIVVTGNPTIDASRMSGLDFGNRLTVDFGDAPQSYGIASHGFVPGLLLGVNWDAEQSSQFSANALGDDTTGSIDANGVVQDDEDGVVLSRPLVAGSLNNRFTVTAQNTTGITAYLQAWADYNHDGDFLDAGEKIISNSPLGTGTSNFTFSAPANAVLGSTFVRFRYGTAIDTPATGSAATGEVEDYVFNVVDTLNLAVDDSFTVSRNSAINSLDVLANDFRLPGENLEILSVSSSRAGAILQISSTGTVLYTPPNGFIGQDVFTYTIANSGGDTDTATVVVDVNLFFENPLAIDDSFDVSTNAVDFPLNVLANDIEGSSGALTIISITQPDKGGQINIGTGGKSLRYTPPRNFGGTEFFTYTVADAAGARSTANVTLHTLPGDRANDDVLIQLVATDLAGAPITAIQQGQEFRIEMYVDDLRFNAANPGVAAGVFAAYTDLLYNLQLVSTVASTDPSDRFNFKITFFNDYFNFQKGNATIPGIINELGAFSNRSVLNAPDPVLLAAITFSARSPGIAQFTPDPADDLPDSDTLLYDTPGSGVPIERIRYIGTSIEIVGDGIEFPVAVDDSVSQTIPAGTIRFPINVLANDRPGSTGQITLTSVTNGLFGVTSIDTRGTTNTADDRVLYTPTTGFNGADQFTYTIKDARGIQSTARVTVRVGAADANDIVAMRLSATDLAGNSIDQITVGQQFELRGYIQDLRGFGANRGIFAAYEDVLYSSNLVSPVASNSNTPNLGFQVVFGPSYQQVLSGDIRTPGVINEIGAVQGGANSNDPNNTNPLGSDEFLLFRVRMSANSVGVATFIGDPSDISPLHDTLTFDPAQAVNFDLIRYGFKSLTIVGGGEGEFYNSNNPHDVNNDGVVSPVDALLVINRLNSGGSGNLSGGEGEDGGNKYFVDVNGDGKISPIDALLVINALNSRAGGEGEWMSVLSSGSLAESAQGVVAGDLSVPAGPLDSGIKIGVSMKDYEYTALQNNAASATDSVFDDTEDADDMLDQIAVEVTESWRKKLRG